MINNKIPYRKLRCGIFSVENNIYMSIKHFYVDFGMNKWYNITKVAYIDMLNKSRRDFYEF